MTPPTTTLCNKKGLQSDLADCGGKQNGSVLVMLFEAGINKLRFFLLVLLKKLNNVEINFGWLNTKLLVHVVLEKVFKDYIVRVNDRCSTVG